MYTPCPYEEGCHGESVTFWPPCWTAWQCPGPTWATPPPPAPSFCAQPAQMHSPAGAAQTTTLLLLQQPQKCGMYNMQERIKLQQPMHVCIFKLTSDILVLHACVMPSHFTQTVRRKFNMQPNPAFRCWVNCLTVMSYELYNSWYIAMDQLMCRNSRKWTYM